MSCMEMTDQPQWQSGPVEFRVAVCRALLVALADSWVASGVEEARDDQADYAADYAPRDQCRGYGEGGAHAFTEGLAL